MDSVGGEGGYLTDPILIVQVDIVHLEVLQGLLALLADKSCVTSPGTGVGAVTKNYTKLGTYEDFLPEFRVFQ